jgi:hypothetical protein
MFEPRMHRGEPYECGRSINEQMVGANASSLRCIRSVVQIGQKEARGRHEATPAPLLFFPFSITLRQWPCSLARKRHSSIEIRYSLQHMHFFGLSRSHVNERRPTLWRCPAVSERSHRMVESMSHRVHIDDPGIEKLFIEAL